MCSLYMYDKQKIKKYDYEYFCHTFELKIHYGED